MFWVQWTWSQRQDQAFTMAIKCNIPPCITDDNRKRKRCDRQDGNGDADSKQPAEFSTTLSSVRNRQNRFSHVSKASFDSGGYSAYLEAKRRLVAKKFQAFAIQHELETALDNAGRDKCVQEMYGIAYLKTNLEPPTGSAQAQDTP